MFREASGPPDPPPAELATVEEAAAYCRLSVRALFRAVGRKQLPRLRIGGNLRFRLEDLDAFMQSHPQGG